MYHILQCNLTSDNENNYKQGRQDGKGRVPTSDVEDRSMPLNVTVGEHFKNLKCLQSLKG